MDHTVYMAASDLAIGVEFVRATLLFETGPDGARFLKNPDLLYKGQVMHFGNNGVRAHERQNADAGRGFPSG